MDRDSRENTLDPVERSSPSTGENDTGEVGTQEAHILERRQEKGTHPAPANDVKAPESDRAPGNGA